MSRRIPRKEADLLLVAQKIASGLKKNPNIFNNPPLDYKALETLIEHLKAAKNQVRQKKAAYQAAVTIKQNNFKQLYKDVLYTAKYCIQIADKDESILSKIGLQQKRKTPEPPGQCLDLKIENQTIKSMTLKWKKTKNRRRLKNLYNTTSRSRRKFQ